MPRKGRNRKYSVRQQDNKPRYKKSIKYRARHAAKMKKAQCQKKQLLSAAAADIPEEEFPDPIIGMSTTSSPSPLPTPLQIIESNKNLASESILENISFYWIFKNVVEFFACLRE